MFCIKRQVVTMVMVIVVMFLAACDDSSSSQAETTDVFSMTEEYSYFVAYDADMGECVSGLSISTVQFDFGPGNNVNVSIKEARGTVKLSGVYRKDKDNDNKDVYKLQLSASNKVTNWIYSPGNDGGFGIVMGDEFSVYVYDQKSREEFLQECSAR